MPTWGGGLSPAFSEPDNDADVGGGLSPAFSEPDNDADVGRGLVPRFSFPPSLCARPVLVQ
jgi:hypothetical protein